MERTTTDFAGYRDSTGRLAKYAWPGGYPIYYLAADNGVICADCANNDRSADNLDPDYPDDDQWRIVAADVNYEDNRLFCDNCSERIESAYCDDDDDSNVEIQH